MPVAFQNLTFVKADMNKCIAHFAPFQNREYFELRGLQHGLDEPENSPRIRTSLNFSGSVSENLFDCLSESRVEQRHSGKTCDWRNISIETDCAALAKRFQELLPIWMEQNGAGRSFVLFQGRGFACDSVGSLLTLGFWGAFLQC